MGRLEGKHALITGASAGIGLETARRFVAEGARVAITGRQPQALEAARLALGPQAIAIGCDAGAIDDQRELARQLAQHWGRLDVVFVNAADVTHRRIEDWDEAAYERLMAINLKGPFFLLQALSPLLADPASVILCGSVSAHIGLPQSNAYAASKAALLSLARTLSGEWIGRGIRVNGLSPGPTATSAFDRLGLSGAEREAMVARIEQLVPLGRLGTPTELAQAAVFLASDESAFVVGSELQVDGGVANL
ncbi:SDR family oxidoreductase [Marilutibacter maris]|uniref:Short-chain dehydrogenase n=1 Tax=Marilutibacter maris TaxID=1605891 RepID=A0A2U9T6R4_9GAMM|nr:SDR family oxidoreductase [Lysobacter maris]AWV08243.1 short-chain dehydrogenase [Lysobacter maris]